MGLKTQPVVRFLVLCETMIAGVDGRYSLINIFDRITHPAVPVNFGNFCIACGMTDGKGEGEIVFDLLAPDHSSAPIHVGRMPIRFESRLGGLCAFMKVSSLAFPWEGVYMIRALVDGEPIREAPVTVVVRR